MSDIIHDPTRGWLLLTEKWPDPVNIRDYKVGNPIYDKCKKLVSDCLSNAIDIAKEDWCAVKKLVLADVVGKCYVSPCEAIYEYPCGNCKAIVNGIIKEGGRGHIEDHHSYSVDAEFEVVNQALRIGTTDNRGVEWFDCHKDWKGPKGQFYEYRQIARLVKAKPMEDFKKFTLLNPTDSVTSDGTKAKEACKSPVSDKGECALSSTLGHRICGQKCGMPQEKDVEHDIKPKETESQYELWDEIVRDYTDPDGFLDVYLASKSFRIERI